MLGRWRKGDRHTMTRNTDTGEDLLMTSAGRTDKGEGHQWWRLRGGRKEGRKEGRKRRVGEARESGLARKGGGGGGGRGRRGE